VCPGGRSRSCFTGVSRRRSNLVAYSTLALKAGRRTCCPISRAAISNIFAGICFASRTVVELDISRLRSRASSTSMPFRRLLGLAPCTIYPRSLSVPTQPSLLLDVRAVVNPWPKTCRRHLLLRTAPARVRTGALLPALVNSDFLLFSRHKPSSQLRRRAGGPGPELLDVDANAVHGGGSMESAPRQTRLA